MPRKIRRRAIMRRWYPSASRTDVTAARPNTCACGGQLKSREEIARARGSARSARRRPSTTATRRARPAARRDRPSRRFRVSATATVPSFGSGNGPSKRPTPSGIRPAMPPTSTPARHAANPPRACTSVRQRPTNRRPPGQRASRAAVRLPLSGEPRHTTRPIRCGIRFSSSAQIKTPPKLWPTRCTVSPGTASMKLASAAVFAASEPRTDG